MKKNNKILFYKIIIVFIIFIILFLLNKYFSKKKEFFQSTIPLLPEFVTNKDKNRNFVDTNFSDKYNQVKNNIAKIKNITYAMVNHNILKKNFNLDPSDLNTIRNYLNVKSNDNIDYYSRLLSSGSSGSSVSLIDQLVKYKRKDNEENNYVKMFDYLSTIFGVRLQKYISTLSSNYLDPNNFKRSDLSIQGVLAFREFVIYICIDSFDKIDSIIKSLSISPSQIECTLKELNIRQNVETYPLLLNGNKFVNN